MSEAIVRRRNVGSGVRSYLPNIISIARIVLAPVIIWLIITGQSGAAFAAFLLAGVTDALDGFLAKRFGWQTELGAYLDPLADKLLLVSIFLALGYFGDLPVWLVIAVVSRDLLIVVAVMLSWMLDHPVRIRPLALSKLNTAVQIVLAGVTLGESALALGMGQLKFGLVWLTGLLTLASLFAYLRNWLRHMAGYEN